MSVGLRNEQILAEKGDEQMKFSFPHWVSLLAIAAVVHAGPPVTELEFSQDSVNLTSDFDTVSNKARLLRLSNGTLIAAWQEGVGEPGGAWGPDGIPFAPRDILMRTSADDGKSWSTPINVSNTATLTDAAVFYDRTGDGTGLAAFFGDSGKPSLIAAGSDLALIWNDAYCGEGVHGPARYPVEAGEIEVPYRCLYVARIKISSGAATLMAVDRLTDATRDVANEVIRATGVGFAAVWQEDPAGLQLGHAHGGGHGLSGARVSMGTDVWYAWIEKPQFSDVLSSWHGPVAISDNFDYPNGVAVEGGASRPGLFLAGSPAYAMLVYEEAKNVGPEDHGKHVRFHEFPFNDPPEAQAGFIVSSPPENARRARVIAASSPGKTVGARMVLMWRQGEGIQGAPADFMMRIGIVGEGADLAAVPNAGFRVADLRPAVDTSDPGNSEPALNISGARLSDVSSIDPHANAMAHRAVMDGDFIYAGYTQDRNVTDGLDEYRYYLRWSADAGSTWSEPASISSTGEGSTNAIEPRLIRTPGTVNSGSPEDIRNPDVYVMAWGTERTPAGEMEPVRDALYVTRTIDRGRTFEPVQALAATRTSADQTDEQIQLRVSPNGQEVKAVWLRRGAGRSDVIFNSAMGITRTADLAVAMTASNTRPDVGATVQVSIRVTNRGPQTATELGLNVEVPAGLPVSNVESKSGICDSLAGVRCELDDLAPGASAVVEIYVLAELRGTRTLVTEVSAREEEPELLDNRAEVAIDAIPNANIVLSVTRDEARLMVGDLFAVRFQVNNDGPQRAGDVMVDISLSPHTVMWGSVGCELSGSHIRCAAPDLAQDGVWAGAVFLRAASEGTGSIEIMASAMENDSMPENNVEVLELVVSNPSPAGNSGGGCVYAPDGGRDSTMAIFLALCLVWRLARWLRNTRSAGALH